MTAQIAAAMADDDPADAGRLLASSNASAIYYGKAAVKIVDKTAAGDPDGALALARTITDPAHEAVALATVAGYRPAAEQAGLYAEAFSLAIGAHSAPGGLKSANITPWIAELAYRNDPIAGGLLFAKSRAEIDRPGQDATDRSSDLPYAFYAASFAPAESRLRIERDFARLKAANQPGTALLPCALAMAAIDPAHAYDMAKQIPGDAGFDAQRKIAQYLLADEPTRHTLRFDRWLAPDTWTPGTPTEW